MKFAQKIRPAVAPRAVSAVEPLESRTLFSASPVGDSPTEHAVQTVTARNGALNGGDTSLNFTKIASGVLSHRDE